MRRMKIWDSNKIWFSNLIFWCEEVSFSSLFSAKWEFYEGNDLWVKVRIENGVFIREKLWLKCSGKLEMCAY